MKINDFIKFLDQCLETYPSDIDDKTNALLQVIKYRADKLKMDEDEIFHLIHKAIWLINEGREDDDEILVLDGEIGEAVKIILGEDF